MANWIAFQQYAGFEILDDASKIRTPQGEFDLTPDKLFFFTNPNTGTKNFAMPDVLLARALKGGAPKIRVPKDPSAIKVGKTKRQPSDKKLAREAAKAAKLAAKEAKQAARAAKIAKREAKKQQVEEKKIGRAKKKVQLLPDHIADQLRMGMHSQARKEGGQKEERGLNGMLYFYNNNSDRAIVILYNTDKNLVLLRVDGPNNWRSERWFYNPDTEKYLQFDEPVHKPGYGNAAVIWPDGLDGEHLLGPKHNELRLKRELARASARRDKAAGLANQEQKAEAEAAVAQATADNGGQPLSYYQRKKAEKLAQRLGIKSLDTITAAREAVGM
jgi:hypothetical protein